MIAVTIAVGDAYRDMAIHAVDRMRRFTNLPVHVLSEADMVRWIRPQDVTRWGPRASMMLKFKLFEIFESDRILYFDSDVFACRPWRPQSMGTARDFVCTRDLYGMEHIRTECARVGLPPDSYFNAGFFIAGRDAHSALLATGFQRMMESDDPLPTYFEQTYFNLAVRDYRIEPRFVDRRFNYMQWRRTDEMASATPAVLVHAAGDPDSKGTLIEELKESDMPAMRDCDDRVAAEVSGKFFKYDRVGYDQRAIELRGDGTIGHGAADLETHWLVLKATPESGPVMVIGNHRDITCELTLGSDGKWSGRWRRYERMPVRLYRHRGQVVADYARQLAGNASCEIAEIGVNDGETSIILLEQCPTARLWMVDHWSATTPQSAYWNTNDPMSRRSGEEAEQAFLRAVRVTEGHRSRRRIIKADFAEAADLVPDRSLDLVFLDADHSLDGTIKAFETWIEKVRPGGILCGHDYDYDSQTYLVAAAVRECCDARGLSYTVSDDYVWATTVTH